MEKEREQKNRIAREKDLEEVKERKSTGLLSTAVKYVSRDILYLFKRTT